MLIVAFTLTACSVNVTINEPGAAKDEAAEAEVSQEDIEKNIIGKWIVTDWDNQHALTNEKYLINFTSDAKAYVSASFLKSGGDFVNSGVADFDIRDNIVTITSHPDEYTTVVDEYTIIAINADEFTADPKVVITVNGTETLDDEEPIRFIKINDNFSEDILGTWEGRCTSEGSVFDDGQDHRWEYKADGTYVYYSKDGEDWVPSDNTLNEYFVDGNLLCTRWMEGDEENREWWEVSIDGDKMNWTALREDEDGNTFTAEFEMTKVK